MRSCIPAFSIAQARSSAGAPASIRLDLPT